jgi:hypothetical protein
LLGIVTNSAYGITLDCDFKIQNTYWGTKYACVAQNLTTSETNRKITEINGKHLEGKTNDDVAKVLVEHQNCPYLPVNLGAHFQNLEVLYVMRSHVNQLTSTDLEGLTKLRIFDVSYNPITQIHRDFFKGHESIEIISFYECDLHYIEAGALEPLVNLKEGHFQYNDCIDFRGDEEEKLPAMIKKIEEKCDPKVIRHATSSSSLFEDDYEFDEYDFLHHNPRRTTTEKPPKILTKIVTEYRCNLTFTRRNANPIILILLVIIVALVAYIFRIKAIKMSSFM